MAHAALEALFSMMNFRTGRAHTYVFACVYKSHRKDAPFFIFLICGAMYVSHRTTEMKRCELLINLSWFELTATDRYTQQK